jgi:hypothetical protein
MFMDMWTLSFSVCVKWITEFFTETVLKIDIDIISERNNPY